MLIPLALFFINLFFLFIKIFSIFLHGVYSIYAINIPSINGANTLNRFPTQSPIPVKLSNSLYNNISTTPIDTQYIHHFVPNTFSFFIFYLPFI